MMFEAKHAVRIALIGGIVLGPVAIDAAEPARTQPERLAMVPAVDRALAQFPTVGAASAAVTAAREEAAAVKATRLPRLDIAGSVTRYQEPMVVTPIHGLTPDSSPEFDATLIQAGLSLRYALYDGGARRARIAGAESEAGATQAGLESAEQELVARTVVTYLAVLGSASVLAAHDGRIRALELELDRVVQLLEVGRAADVDTRRVEGALAAARAERVRLRTTLETSERRLARLTGSDVEQVRVERLVPVTLASSDVPDRRELERRALAANPEVRRAREELQGREADLALARSARRPSVELTGNYVDFGSGQGDFTAEWNAGISFGFSLFDGGAASSRIAAAEARVRRASEALRNVELEIQQAMDEAFSRWEEARARRESLTAAEDHFSEVARIERLRLEQGAGTEVDYLNAESDLLQARADLVWTRYEEILAVLDLWAAAGELHPARLEEALRNSA